MELFFLGIRGQGLLRPLVPRSLGLGGPALEVLGPLLLVQDAAVRLVDRFLPLVLHVSLPAWCFAYSCRHVEQELR